MFNTLVHTPTEEEINQVNQRFRERNASCKQIGEALESFYQMPEGKERDITFENIKALFSMWGDRLFCTQHE